MRVNVRRSREGVSFHFLRIIPRRIEIVAPLLSGKIERRNLLDMEWLVDVLEQGRGEETKRIIRIYRVVFFSFQAPTRIRHRRDNEKYPLFLIRLIGTFESRIPILIGPNDSSLRETGSAASI